MACPLEHERSGSPADPTLVLLTGFGATTGHWPRTLIGSLATERDVVAVQNPGVGGSSDAGADSCSATAGRVTELLDHLALGPVDVLGWSMGGMVAQALAVLRPDLVGRLVLAATPPGTGAALPPEPSALAALASAEPARMLEVLFPGDPAAADAYRAAIAPAGDVPPDVLAAQAAATRAWRRADDPAGPGTVDIAGPVLIAQGGRDALCPAGNAELLAAVLPDAEVVRHAAAGHGVLFADPTETARTVLDFLARTARRRRQR